MAPGLISCSVRMVRMALITACSAFISRSAASSSAANRRPPASGPPTFAPPRPSPDAKCLTWTARGVILEQTLDGSGVDHASLARPLPKVGQGTRFFFATLPSWAKGNFWAPEIAQHRGKFFVYYTARRADIEWTINHVPWISGGVQASIEVARPALFGTELKTQHQLYWFLLFFAAPGYAQVSANYAPTRRTGFVPRSAISSPEPART